MKSVDNSEKLIEKMKLWDKRFGGYIDFILWPKQLEFLRLVQKREWVILLKKRQVGGSQIIGADSLVNVMCVPKWTCLVLSKSGSDAEEFLNRVKECYHSMPEEIRQAAPLKRETLDVMEFANGSRIISLPSNRGAGMTADRVVIDEAAFITKGEAGIDLATVLRRVQPTIEKAKGQIIIISTANGYGLFKDMYYKGKSGLGRFKPFFFSCWDDPTFSQEARQELVEQFGEDHVNQEFPRTDDEAFLSSGRPRFDMPTLNKYEKFDLVQKPIFTGDLLVDGNVVENKHGNFNVYHSRKQRGSYIISCDVAEGLGGDHDLSIAKVFDRSNYFQVAEYADHIEPDEYGIMLAELGKYYNHAVIIVEKNNHGNTTLSNLLSTNYPESLIFSGLYNEKMKPDDEFRRGLARFGWKTTATTRPLIINTLARFILEGLLTPNEKDMDELRAFTIQKGKAQAEQGKHDDRVLSTAIGVYLMTSDAFNEFYPINKASYHASCASCWNFEGSVCSLTERQCSPTDWCGMYEDAGLQLSQEFQRIAV